MMNDDGDHWKYPELITEFQQRPPPDHGDIAHAIASYRNRQATTEGKPHAERFPAAAIHGTAQLLCGECRLPVRSGWEPQHTVGPRTGKPSLGCPYSKGATGVGTTPLSLSSHALISSDQCFSIHSS